MTSMLGAIFDRPWLGWALGVGFVLPFAVGVISLVEATRDHEGIARRAAMGHGIDEARERCLKKGGDTLKRVVGHAMVFPLGSDQTFVYRCLRMTVTGETGVALYRITTFGKAYSIKEE